MFKIEPAATYLLVEPLTIEEMNKSELAYVPPDREHSNFGKVLAVGESGYIENYNNIFWETGSFNEVGNIIAYIKFSEQVLPVNSKEYHLVRLDKIIAKITEK